MLTPIAAQRWRWRRCCRRRTTNATKLINEQRYWAKQSILGAQNPNTQRKRPRSSRACMHVVF